MLTAIILLCGATIVVLGSPGPAPLALAATGASFGARRGMPFLVGILAGLVIVALLSATGVAVLLAQGGWLVTALFAISLAYFTYVAFKIATAPMGRVPAAAHAAPSARDGFILNLTNPKAYAAFAALYAGFGLPIEPVWLSTLVTGVLILLVATAIDTAWLLAGGALAPIFDNERFGRILRAGFAIAMVSAVAASIWAVGPNGL